VCSSDLSYFGTEAASSAEQWGRGVSADLEKTIRRKIYSNEKLPNNCSSPLDFSSVTRVNNIKDSYYIVVQTFQMTLTYASITYNYVMPDVNKFSAVVRGNGRTGLDPNSRADSNTTTVLFTQSK
jgi:hypothetical protein